MMNMCSVICLARRLSEVRTPSLMFVAGIKDLHPPPRIKDVEFPEKSRLHTVLKVPVPPNAQKMTYMSKRLDLIRGREEIHTSLIHKQYGIQALNGGRLRYGHFEMIRNTIRRRMDEKTMFAIWRVDPPWMPVSKKGQGKRMGGGKGSIHHYVTPVKKDRIIVEMGGHVEFEEVKPILDEVVMKLPLAAQSVSAHIMEEQRKEEKLNEALNINPYAPKYIIENNMSGVLTWCSPEDRKWFWAAL